MSATGIYLVCRLPATVFREQYLTTMRELVGAQRLADGREEMYERFARALASAVSAVLWCLCLSFLPRPLLKSVSATCQPTAPTRVVVSVSNISVSRQSRGVFSNVSVSSRSRHRTSHLHRTRTILVTTKFSILYLDT